MLRRILIIITIIVITGSLVGCVSRQEAFLDLSVAIIDLGEEFLKDVVFPLVQPHVWMGEEVNLIDLDDLSRMLRRFDCNDWDKLFSRLSGDDLIRITQLHEVIS